MGAGVVKPASLFEPVDSSGPVIVDDDKILWLPQTFTVSENVVATSEKLDLSQNRPLDFTLSGAGVLRIGILANDPYGRNDCTKEAVYELEIGLGSGQSERYLFIDNGCYFCFGNDKDNCKEYKYVRSKEFYVYVLSLFGEPTLKVKQGGRKIEWKETNNTAVNINDNGTDVQFGCKTKKAVVVWSNVIKPAKTYNLEWDMQFWKVSSQISEKQPKFGFLRFGIMPHKPTADAFDFKNLGNNAWLTESAVVAYPYSNTLAFRIDAQTKSICHNLLVESVQNVTTESLDMALDRGGLYLVVEMCSGELHLQETSNNVQQTIGSTFLVEGFNPGENEDHADLMEKISNVARPCRLQFGNTDTKFVVEYRKRLAPSDLAHLKARVTSIGEVKTVQVIAEPGEDLTKYDLEDSFTREYTDRITIEQRREHEIWIITFLNTNDARNVWMEKERVIGRTKVTLMPYYNQIGISFTKGIKPLMIKDTCSIDDLDETKLSLIKNNSSSRKKLENHLKGIPNVTIAWDDSIDDEIVVKYAGFDPTWKEATTNAVKRYVDEFSIEDNPMSTPRPVTHEKAFPREQFDKIMYIDKKGELSKAMRTFPSSRYLIDEAKGEVKLKGDNKDEIRQAYNRIQALLLKIDIVQISISKTLAKCLKELQTDKKCIELPPGIENDDFVIKTEKCLVWFVARSDRESTTRKQFIEKYIKGKLDEMFIDQAEVPFQTSFLPALNTDKWEDIIKEMLSNNVHIEEDIIGMKLIITTTKERFEDAKRQIIGFIDANSKEMETVYIGRHAVSYLLEYPLDVSATTGNVEFLQDVHGDPSGYVQITGSKSGITEMKKAIEEARTDIKMVRFYLSKPWLASAAFVKLGQNSTFESDNNCILNMEIADYLSQEGVPCVAVYKDSGCCIFAMQSDIRMSTHDAIVNCTDSKLQSKYGLSKALCSAAGNLVYRECAEYIDKNKQLELGKVFVSSSGQLQCHKILHVACPRWDDRGEAKRELLAGIVTNALKAAADLQLTSIIFPAVGCVTDCQIPVQECAIEIVNAVAKYMSQNKDCSIKEVFLSDLKEDIINALTTAMEKCFTTTPHFVFKHGRPLPKIDDVSQLAKSSRFGKISGNTRFSKKPRKGHGIRFHPDDMHFGLHPEDGNTSIRTKGKQGNGNNPFSSGLPFNIDISDTLTLHVETGSMESQNVDVIVNTTANFPDMGCAVSRALLRAGGQGIAQECKNKGDGEFQKGNVVRTSGGKLNCKHIYHTKIEIGWEREGVEGIYRTVTKCLKSADKFKCQSISFPSIGTGRSNFPADKVANGMVRAVCDFTRDYPNSPVKDVHIVIFHADYVIVKIFEKEIPKLLAPTGLMDNIKPGKVIGKSRKAKPTFTYTNPGNHSAADDVVIVKLITTGNVKTLIKDFEKLVDDEYEKRSLDYGTDLGDISTSEEVWIKGIDKDQYMSLEIDKKKKEIILSGLKEYISKIEADVRILVTIKIPELRRKHEKGEQIAKTVEWNYEDQGKLLPVSATNNYEIHMSYLNGEDFEYKNTLDGKTYKVLFATLEEHEVDDPNTKRRLYQRTKISDDGIEMPPHWKIISSGDATNRVTLNPTDTEFNDVKTALRKANSPFKNIINIIRIEDKYKWLQYETKKRQMEKQNPKGVTNERLLWHGTDSDTIEKIITGGYDRSFRGKNATYYGDGVYFAVGADYSHRYAIPDPQGIQRIFYNRVLTGEVCVGVSGMNVLPVKGTNNLGLNVLYDSAVDNMSNPVMYVILHDTQAYPEYLIEYK